MVELNLLPNEGIILQDVAYRRQSKGGMLGDLVLTNSHLYFVYQTGTFRKVTETLKIPLNQIKIINHQAQAILGGSTSSPQLQIFLKTGQEEFSIGSYNFAYQTKKEISKWINAINEALDCNPPIDLEQKQSKGIPGSKEVAETLKNTVDVFKETMGQPSVKASTEQKNITSKCIGCMAPISGTSGQRVRCKYCDTDQVL